MVLFPLALCFVAKANSSKKVQRAAKAAASSRGASERRQIGFPLVVVLIVILGVGLVVAARGTRDPVTSPTTADHWHAAYTIYNCGQRMPHFTGSSDPDGIHSHNDSLIHVHPFNSSATGDDARVGVLLDAMNADITVEGIFANNGEFSPILAADGCNGEPAAIKVARWNLGGADGPTIVEVFEDNFRNIRLLGDGEGFSFALVPLAEDPPPPADDVIVSLVGVGSQIEFVPTTTLDPNAPFDLNTLPNPTEDPSQSEDPNTPTPVPAYPTTSPENTGPATSAPETPVAPSTPETTVPVTSTPETTVPVTTTSTTVAPSTPETTVPVTSTP